MNALDFQIKKIIELTKTKSISCSFYCAVYQDNVEDVVNSCFRNYMLYLLVCYHKANWKWQCKEHESQTFFSKKEALESMKNNKVEWR